MDVRADRSELAIFREDGCVRSLWNWVIGIAVRAGIFANYARARVLLSSQVFEFSDTSETEIVGIIDDRRRLKSFAVERRVLKLQRAVGQFAITQLEELIYWAGVN